MNLLQDLRQRRVPQIVSGYVLGGWGVLQFLAFLESRMTVSPHLVNLIGLALLFLLPSVITLAWVHGRPGKDTWGRAPKMVVPANLAATALLLVILFSGRDLGAVTQTIAVEDENGTVKERVVPKDEYRRRVLIFYPENQSGEEGAWAGETIAYLMSLDLGQDGFVDAVVPLTMADAMRDAGSDDGHGLPRPLQRKVTRDAHIGYFLTGSIGRRDSQWQLTTELHESESGKTVANRTNEAADLFTLVDRVSLQLREDLGIPAAHLDNNPDLPIAELTSTDPQAVTSQVRAIIAVAHHNDWEAGLQHLEDAVGRDPRFALAQFLLFGVHTTMGNSEGASAAIAAAMDNLYRVPERTAFLIKSQYYFDEKKDPDKAMAVLHMWSRIYPDDVNAYEMQATFYFIRQDLPRTIAAYERILAIDPSRVKYMEELADLHTQLGNYDEAEGYLKRYVDIYPTRTDGYDDLSDFYSATGRLDEARKVLDKALLLEPENLDLNLSLIDLEIKVGKYHESEQALADLMARAGTAKERMRICARQLKLGGVQGMPDVVLDRLEAIYEATLEIQSPLQANIIYSVMLPAASMAGRPTETLSRLAEVKSRIPAPFTDLAGIGEAWVYADLGQVSAATASLAAAVSIVDSYKLETFRPSISLIEGMIAEAAGDLDAAIPHFREAADKAIKPDPSYQVRLARALRLTGEDEEAMAVLQDALKIEPAHPEYNLELAHLHHRRDDPVKARKHLNVALEAWGGAGPEYLPAREARQLADQLKAL
ncbi:MAG: tetratricopeptide repeat protein [Candidatus Krumholzibacteriota bacterium]